MKLLSANDNSLSLEIEENETSVLGSPNGCGFFRLGWKWWKDMKEMNEMNECFVKFWVEKH